MRNEKNGRSCVSCFVGHRKRLRELAQFAMILDKRSLPCRDPELAHVILWRPYTPYTP